MRISLVGAASMDQMFVQGMFRTGTAPHWLENSGELAIYFTGRSTLAEQHSGADSDCNVLERWPCLLLVVALFGLAGAVLGCLPGAEDKGMRES